MTERQTVGFAWGKPATPPDKIRGCPKHECFLRKIECEKSRKCKHLKECWK